MNSGIITITDRRTGKQVVVNAALTVDSSSTETSGATLIANKFGSGTLSMDLAMADGTLSIPAATPFKLQAQGWTFTPTGTAPPPVAPPPANALQVTTDLTKARLMNRQGINLSVPTYYDCAQYLANLLWPNAGFEPIYRKFLLNVVNGSADSATDGYTWDNAPANFFAGKSYMVLTGANYGKTGKVVSSASDSTNGHTFVFDQNFSPALTNLDRIRVEGPDAVLPNYIAGWWNGNGWTLRADPRPGSAGGYSAYTSTGGSITSYFDSSAGIRFMTLNGQYKVTVWAKADKAGTTLSLNAGRGATSIFSQSVPLTTSWAQYTFAFTANENQSTPVGTGEITFSLNGAGSLDDCDARNTADTGLLKTPYVAKLQSGNFVRLRAWSNMGFTPQMITSRQSSMPPCTSSMNIESGTALVDETEYQAVPIAWPDAADLALEIGAEEIHLIANSCDDVADFLYYAEWLFGDATTPGGKARTALGLPSFGTLFTRVILSFGNEQWNSTGSGQTDGYAAVNGQQQWSMIQRYQRIQAALSAVSYIPASFTFTATVQGGDGGGQWSWLQTFLNTNPKAPVEINQYISPAWPATPITDAPTMIQKMWTVAVGRGTDPTDGYYGQYATLQKAGHASPEVYEHGMGFIAGEIPASLNYLTASQAAALSVLAGILSRDKTFGPQNETLFCAFNSYFKANGGPIPLWGAVRNLMGSVALDRPVWLMLELLNGALSKCPYRAPTTIASPPMTGTIPLIVDALLTNQQGQYAYVVVNYDAADHALTLPVTPKGATQVSELWAANLSDTNESSALCTINTSSVNGTAVTARKGTMTVYGFAG